MKTLGDSLPEEMDRVRKIRDVYLTFPGGQIAAAMMAASLDNAAKAAVSGDVAEMIRAHEDLKGYEL